MCELKWISTHLSRLLLVLTTVLHLLVPMAWGQSMPHTASGHPLEVSESVPDSKSLVVFFSRAGENHEVGFITKGNTHIMAELIAEATDSDLYELRPRVPYPNDYRACVNRAKLERAMQARPELVGQIDIAPYDTIYIGYPIWLGTYPMPLHTFVEEQHWKDKVVVPFCTHEGSGLKRTAEELQRQCSGARVTPGIALIGKVAQEQRHEARRITLQQLKEIRHCSPKK